MSIFLEASLLRVLQYFKDQDTIRFVELSQKLNFGTDLTGYYLRRLERKDMIEKIDRGTYRITGFGKSILAHTTQLSDLARPRVSILLIAQQEDSVLIRMRTIQPFIGQYEWPTRPLSSDESLPDAAAVLVSRLTGELHAPTFRGFFRQIDMLHDVCFDDKLYAVHTIDLGSEVEIVEHAKAGTTLAIPVTEVNALPKKSASLTDVWAYAQGQAAYFEQTYHLSVDDIYEGNPED